MRLPKVDLTQWKRQIGGKIWTIEDTCCLSHCVKLKHLVNLVFSAIKDEDATLIEDRMPLGFNFIFNTTLNDKLGEDGYDNYQAPMLDNKPLYSRRMWVNGRLKFFEQPALGSNIVCEEKIDNVKTLTDSTFVRIKRTYKEGGIFCIEELRTLMYTNGKFTPLSDLHYELEYPDGALMVKPTKDEILKYSMLSYNCHKIHYDLEYARKAENLPDIIVQGPFMVTMILQFLARKHYDFRPKTFSYKNLYPWPVDKPATLWFKKDSSQHERLHVGIYQQESKRNLLSGIVEL